MPTLPHISTRRRKGKHRTYEGIVEDGKKILYSCKCAHQSREAAFVCKEAALYLGGIISGGKLRDTHTEVNPIEQPMREISSGFDGLGY